MTMITWTSRTSAADASWHSVTYGNGLFVAVSSGVGGKVMTSPDGINWTLRTPTPAYGWKGVTYGNGLFVAVGDNSVITSPNGIDWTSTSITNNNWVSITYGNGLFVAVTSWLTLGKVMISPDGINWTLITPTATGNGWNGVTYGNGLFVAVGINLFTPGVNDLMTSPDGINWTLRTSNDAANGWKGVTYGNGLFVAVTSGGNVATSPDGVNWTLRTPPYIYWYGVTYGNGLFVAVTDWAAANGGNNVMISPDGTNWTPETAIDNVWQSVTYGNGLFVAVSRSITGNRVMTGSMYPSCISTPKYSGDPVILRATPRDGIGPYLVEFYKDEVPVPIDRLTSPLVITANPTTKSIVENTLVGGTYILDDIDVANAVGGRINFSVYIEDSCPTGPMNCGSTCTINIGCVAPVCNFVVT